MKSTIKWNKSSWVSCLLSRTSRGGIKGEWDRTELTGWMEQERRKKNRWLIISMMINNIHLYISLLRGLVNEIKVRYAKKSLGINSEYWGREKIATSRVMLLYVEMWRDDAKYFFIYLLISSKRHHQVPCKMEELYLLTFTSDRCLKMNSRNNKQNNKHLFRLPIDIPSGTLKHKKIYIFRLNVVESDRMWSTEAQIFVF